MNVKVFGTRAMCVDECIYVVCTVRILDGWDFGLSWKAGFGGVRPGKRESEFF